jgi:HD-GYP domain-containing protein (c-di-GMP phosphodiesterase class II)
MIGYSPVVLAAIDPDSFPDVNIYVKQGANFTLYRKDEMELTSGSLDRLRQGGVEYVYIDNGDSSEVLLNVEHNLKSLFSNENIPPMSKNMILVHIMINDIADVFSNPEHPDTCRKCEKLLNQHSFQIDNRQELFEFFSKFDNYETYLPKHSAQVAVLTMYVHKKLFVMTKAELVSIGVGAMLHDVGMLEVSYDIHEKVGILTHGEYKRVRNHPRHGHDMLYKIGLLDPVSLSVVLDHHERFNGTGYPRQLYENEIPRAAQVTAICDTFCALTTSRPYRPASPVEEALRIMYNERKMFNSEIFLKFCKLMSDQDIQV